MDFGNYTEDKQNGRAEVITAGGGFAIARKRWDSLTGEQLAPEITALSEQDVLDQKEILQNKINDLDVLLADIAALK